MTLPADCLAEYWHPRHSECIIDSSCRMECVLLAVADAVVPVEPEPAANASLVEYTTWAERMRLRRLILADVS